MRTVLGVVLRKEWGLAAVLGVPAVAEAVDEPEVNAPGPVATTRQLVPGTLVQRLPGGKTWQACGATSAPCTGERGVVWELPDAQMLSEEHQEITELRLIVGRQADALSLLDERLMLAQERTADSEDELLQVSDSVAILSEDNRTLSNEAQRLADENEKLSRKAQKLRLRWFFVGALAIALPVIGAAALGFAL